MGLLVIYIQIVVPTGNYTEKPVYKGHSREPENVPFMNRLKSHTLFINGENEAVLYRR